MKGNYLNYERDTRGGMLHKKSTEEAIVPQASVLYYGIDLRRKKDFYVLDKEDHEDIMCTIALWLT